MIILSAMIFQSIEKVQSHRNETYISCLVEFDRMFCAISQYKLFFGEQIGVLGKLSTNNKENHRISGAQDICEVFDQANEHAV